MEHVMTLQCELLVPMRELSLTEFVCLKTLLLLDPNSACLSTESKKEMVARRELTVCALSASYASCAKISGEVGIGQSVIKLANLLLHLGPLYVTSKEVAANPLLGPIFGLTDGGAGELLANGSMISVPSFVSWPTS